MQTAATPPICLNLIPQTNEPPAAGPFSPEVERYRPEFERIGEQLASLVETGFQTVSSLDINKNIANDQDLEHPLHHAIHKHLEELVFLYCDLPGNYNAIRRFYADLRLFGMEVEHRMSVGHQSLLEEEELKTQQRLLNATRAVADSVEKQVSKLEAKA